MTNPMSQNAGFSLIECLIAMVITMVGLLSAAGLIVVGIRMQVESRDLATANGLARAKVETLQNNSPTSTERARGGALDSDVTNYNDAPDGRYRRRWKIETHPADAGVPANTQRVTVIILPNIAGVHMPPVQVSTLMPSS